MRRLRDYVFFNFEVLFLIFVQSYEDRGIADSVKSGHPSSIGRIIPLPVFI